MCIGLLIYFTNIHSFQIPTFKTLYFLGDGTTSQTTKELDSEAVSQCPVMAGMFLAPSESLSKSSIRDQCPHPAASTNYASPVEVAISSSVQLSPRMLELLKGLSAPGDSRNPPKPPDWLDRELFDCGRKFYERYLFCMSFSELLSLVMMLSMNSALRPLIYTGLSDSPMKALRRYFSTLLHIITWFTGDVWNPSDPAHKDVLSIRSTHYKLAHIFNSSTISEKVGSVTVSKRGYEEPKNSLNSTICQDLQCIAEEKVASEISDNSHVYINQFDMSMTQYSFMGLIVAHPEKMGAGAATEEEFASLIHFWRGIGWLLGIEDKYNFCSGTVAETRELCLEVERVIAIPSLAKVDWNYEHMATSLITGMSYILPSMSYPAMFRYLAHTMEVNTPAFNRRMSCKHSFDYWVMRATFAIILLMPWVVLIFNRMFRSLIHKVQKSSKLRLSMSRHSKFDATPYGQM